MPAPVSCVHQVDDGGQDARVGLGQHAVAQVEDVAGARAVVRRGQHGSAWPRLDDRPRRQAEGGVEVALHGAPGPDPAAGLVERHPPVDADHVGAGACP